MELLRLPDGDVGAGGGAAKIDMKVPNLSSNAEEDGESAPAMPSLTGMPGMEGINVPGMGGGGKANKGVQMGMSAVGDATIEMNPSAGTLQKVSGTIKTETNTGGMMTVANESKLELVRKN